VIWESILNSDPIPPGLSAEEQRRVLGAEACLWGEVADQFFLDQKLWFRASALAERYWASNETIRSYCPSGGCTYMVASIQARLVKHRCRMVQRGVAAQPYGSEMIASQNRWAQCELFLPPPVAEAVATAAAATNI
jgi:hexosaminidase